MKNPSSHEDKHKPVGQLLIAGFDGTEMSSALFAFLTEIQPAGVILFARNIESAVQTHKLLSDCRACVATPMFLCVDMEGGRVDRLKDAIAPAPSAGEVFNAGDRRLFRQHGKVIGEACRLLGFNTDFAPVLDLGLEASKTVLGSRAVSADPSETVAYARAFLAGLRSVGMLGAGKHFPGLGEANLDTHHELPSVKKSWKKLWAEDLFPYRALRRELPLVMVGHAAYPSVTRENGPASLSKKWITDVLRKKIGYRGLVVSDDLEMGGVLKAGTMEEVAVGHIRAGGDLCLICHQEKLVRRAHGALVREAERDSKFAKRVAESVARVLGFKKRSTVLERRAPPPAREKLERLSRQLWEFSERVRIASL